MFEPEESRPSRPGTQLPAVKKTYVSPSLLEYGGIAKLTQNGAGSGADGGSVAGMMMVCL